MNVEAAGRRTEIRVRIEGKDISNTINRYILSLSCTDNEEDETDDLQITLQDREGLWAEQWLTEAQTEVAAGASMKISADIIRRNWRGDGKDDLCECGTFYLDDIDYSGPPARVTLRATSLPFNASIRQTKKSRAWESYNLQGIAEEMAGNAGLGVMFLADENPFYNRAEQNRESDISFLKKLCHNAGLSLKCYDSTIVIFDQMEYEGKEPELTIEKNAVFRIPHEIERDYTSWSLRVGAADTQYQSCRVSYDDPVSGKCIEAIARVPDYDESGSNQQLEITAKVSSIGEALKLAEKRLRLHNKLSSSAEFTLTGSPEIAAGMTVKLKGWGGWDGNYIISQAAHTVDEAGYQTRIELRRVLEGY